MFKSLLIYIYFKKASSNYRRQQHINVVSEVGFEKAETYTDFTLISVDIQRWFSTLMTREIFVNS